MNTDDEFIKSIENFSINPSDFNHEAHLRLAWLILKQHSLQTAFVKIEKMLLNFVEFLGVKDKYDTDLTFLSLKIIQRAMLASGESTFSGFISKNEALKNDFKRLIAQESKR